MSLLFVGMLQKFSRGGLAVDAAGHVVVKTVTQHADDLGRQCLVQDLDGLVLI
jgi:hypothetical protein